MNDILQEKTVIAGPCSAESLEQIQATMRALHEQGIKIFRAGVWKPRTRPGGFEGYGEQALKWLYDARQEFPDMKLATEVAKPEHIDLCLKYGIDIIWIGARTTASPFAMQDLADLFVKDPHLSEKFDTIYVKNPVNPDIELWIGGIERLQRAGVKNVEAIHRGFCLYDNSVYRNVPTWQIPIDLKKRIPGIKVICDPSHIGGKRDLIAPLCQQAIALGLDGLMVECHCDPDKALTDAKQQILPESFGYILNSIKRPIDSTMVETELTSNDPSSIEEAISMMTSVNDPDGKLALKVLRDKIDKIDDNIIYGLAERLKVCRNIAKVKVAHRLPVFQDKRYNEVLNKFKVRAGSVGLDEDLAESIFNAIHEESVREQTEIIKS